MGLTLSSETANVFCDAAATTQGSPKTLISVLASLFAQGGPSHVVDTPGTPLTSA
jgi:hypothetical protein